MELLAKYAFARNLGIQTSHLSIKMANGNQEGECWGPRMSRIVEYVSAVPPSGRVFGRMEREQR